MRQEPLLQGSSAAIQRQLNNCAREALQRTRRVADAAAAPKAQARAHACGGVEGRKREKQLHPKLTARRPGTGPCMFCRTERCRHVTFRHGTRLPFTGDMWGRSGAGVSRVTWRAAPPAAARSPTQHEGPPPSCAACPSQRRRPAAGCAAHTDATSIDRRSRLPQLQRAIAAEGGNKRALRKTHDAQTIASMRSHCSCGPLGSVVG